MCGIVGYITKETINGEHARCKFMAQGLITDTLRGDDSAGVYAVGHEPLYDSGAAWWAKCMGTGHDLVYGDSYKKHMHDQREYRAAVGHNRAATTGEIDLKGAHPFQVGPITLVHNGTLKAMSLLPSPPHKLEGDVDVDSHVIAHNLALHPVEEVIKLLDGAFTLIWHDARDQTMNIIRNAERPLHMAMSTQQGTMFFASEAPMLDFLGKRAGCHLGAIYYPKPGQWLKWKPDTPLVSPIVKELDLYVYEWRGNTHTGYTYYQHGDNEDWRDDYQHPNVGYIDRNSERDNYVFVGGRTQAIPLLLQEELLSHDLVIEDRIRFKPGISRPITGGKVQVFGLLPNKVKAIILSGNTTLQANMNRDWTVRPVAVYLRPGKGKNKAESEPTIIVRLVAMIPPLPHKTNEEGHNSYGDDTTILDENGDPMIYRGPYGMKMGVTEWYRKVTGGCSMCSTAIPIIDHNEVTWVNNGQDVLCVGCGENIEAMNERYNS